MTFPTRTGNAGRSGTARKLRPVRQAAAMLILILLAGCTSSYARAESQTRRPAGTEQPGPAVTSAAERQAAAERTAGPTPSPLALATRPSAPDPAPQLATSAARGNTNMRSGPGTGYPVLAVLPGGTTCQVTGRDSLGTWLEVACGGRSGWVFVGLVSFSGNVAQLPVPANVPEPPPTMQPTARPTAAPASLPADPVVADLVARINQARVDAGLSPLTWVPELAAAATAHANDMAAHNFFSHTGSDGSDVSVRMRRAGYQPVYWGEILTHVNGGADAAFVQYWGSPHHHDVILGDRYRDIGAAWIRDPREGGFNYYVVVFGRR